MSSYAAILPILVPLLRARPRRVWTTAGAPLSAFPAQSPTLCQLSRGSPPPPPPPLGKTSNLLDTGSISHSHPPHVVCPTEGVIVSLSLSANFMSTSPTTSFLVCFAYYADGIHEVPNTGQSVRISRGAKKIAGGKKI